MTKYVAFLRGIGPGNPNMVPAKLREACKSLGFTNVQSVISSGNLLFETDRSDIKNIQDEMEHAWSEKLGFHSMTIVKSQHEIEEALASDSFSGLVHTPQTYLLVTFLNSPQEPHFTLPHTPAGKTYTILGYSNGVVFSVTDNSTAKTPDLMVWLEKQFGKDITSRTLSTVQRINARFA